MHSVMTKALTVVAAGLLAAIFTAIPAADDTSPAAMMARIEGRQVPDHQGYDSLTLAEIMAKTHVPGVSVAVIKDFEIHWAKGYGTADVTTEAPVTPETRFQAASISKPTAAMGVMRLVQDGTLSLDADINTVLTSWKLPASEYTRDRPVTLRALLSHTSGLGDGFGFPGYHPDDPRPSLVQILNGDKPSNTGKVFMERPPFVAYKYSGGGVTIVQLAVTETTGRAFPELMKALVLDPIGMRHSGFDQPLTPEQDKTAARAHDGQGAAMNAKWHVYPELEAAGLWTTPSDLARLAIELQNALQGKSTRVLSASSAREMIAPVGVGDFAVGFSVRKQGEGWYFTHSGSNWGFQCDLIAHVRKGYGVAIMTNANSGGTVINEVRSRVAAAYKLGFARQAGAALARRQAARLQILELERHVRPRADTRTPDDHDRGQNLITQPQYVSGGTATVDLHEDRRPRAAGTNVASLKGGGCHGRECSRGHVG